MCSKNDEQFATEFLEKIVKSLTAVASCKLHDNDGRFIVRDEEEKEEKKLKNEIRGVYYVQ